MARGRPRKFDRDEALDRALTLFWRQGYEGTSLADLSRAMGINKPSLYAAFGDKDALFAQALDRYASGPGAFMAAALAEPAITVAIARFLKDGARALTDPQRPAGCFAVQGALACSDAAEPARRRLAAMRTASERALAERLARAVTEGQLPPDCPVEDLARTLAAVFQGMAVQAAGGADTAALERVAALALALLPRRG